MIKISIKNIPFDITVTKGKTLFHVSVRDDFTMHTYLFNRTRLILFWNVSGNDILNLLLKCVIPYIIYWCCLEYLEYLQSYLIEKRNIFDTDINYCYLLLPCKLTGPKIPLEMTLDGWRLFTWMIWTFGCLFLLADALYIFSIKSEFDLL